MGAAKLTNPMNAYLFNAGVGRARNHPTRGFLTWDSCESAIVRGSDAEEAQKNFEAWCCSSPDAENPVESVVKRVVGAQFIEQLLTESGNLPLDWEAVSRRMLDTVSATAADDFEQGYWVDVNQAVPAGSSAFDVAIFDAPYVLAELRGCPIAGRRLQLEGCECSPESRDRGPRSSALAGRFGVLSFKLHLSFSRLRWRLP